jgi:hypothetical protein
VGTTGSSNCKNLGTADLNPYVREYTAMVHSIRRDAVVAPLPVPGEYQFI